MAYQIDRAWAEDRGCNRISMSSMTDDLRWRWRAAAVVANVATARDGVQQPAASSSVRVSRENFSLRISHSSHLLQPTYNSLSTKNNSFDHGGRRRPYALRRTDTRANFDGQSFPMFDGQSFRNCSQLIVSFFEFERIYSNSDERGGQTAYQTLQSWLWVPNPHILCHDRDDACIRSK